MSQRLIVVFLFSSLLVAHDIRAELAVKAHVKMQDEAKLTEHFPADLEKRLVQELAVRKPATGTAKFLYLYAAEDEKKNACMSHTFASFVSIDSKGRQKWHSISWLPRGYDKSRTIDVFKNFGEALKAEIFGGHAPEVEGQNYDLTDTLQFSREAGLRLGVWGPMEITDELFDLGQRRSKFLAPKDYKDPTKELIPSVKYKAVDKKSRRYGEAFNCMHAVSDLAGYDFMKSLSGPLNSERGIWGFKGTQDVLDHLSKKGDKWFVSTPRFFKARTSF